MSALTAFRNHCRAMATSELGFAEQIRTEKRRDSARVARGHERDAALWTQLADEIDAYLAGDLEDQCPTIRDQALEGL